MKKMLLAAVVASSFIAGANASDSATGNFQWSGQVPVENIGDVWTIVNTGTTDHDSGSVVWKQDATDDTKYMITDSSNLVFNVATTADETNFADSFDISVQNIRFQSGGGFPQDDVDNVFSVYADGTKLSKKTLLEGQSGDIVVDVRTDASTDVVKAGDETVIQSTILVSSISGTVGSSAASTF